MGGYIVILPFLMIGVMLMIGMLCRYYIPFFQKFLVPASIIGGLVGFLLINFVDLSAYVKPSQFGPITLQLFVLSFISMGLTPGSDSKAKTGDDTEKSGKAKIALRSTLWLGIVSTVLLAAQSGLGFLTWFGVDILTGNPDAFSEYGFLMAHGFIQGPGQAVAMGSVWEQSYQIPNAVPVAVTFSAVGFLAASFIGVPIARWGLRKGAAAFPVEKADQTAFFKGIMEEDSKVNMGRETLASSNMDTITFHIALIAVTYFITFVIGIAIEAVFGPQAMFWGGFFAWAMFIAILLRALIAKTSLIRLLDANVQRHLTGLFVDLLVTGTLISISISTIQTFAFHILAVCLVGMLITLVISVYFGKRLKEHGLELALMAFGSGTGTIPSGLALVRIVDPNFKSSAAFAGGACQAILMLTFTAILMLVMFLPGSGMSPWTVVGIDAAILVGCLIALKVLKLWESKPVF